MKKPVRDCACVIHGTAYDWQYVDKLYKMLQANSEFQIQMHVFTEPNRPVPSHMIKHELQEWPGVSGPKRSWWYKMQMFDTRHIQSRVLYLDLDTVITRNIDWLWELNEQYLWAIKDFKYLWRPTWSGINSSVMLWDTTRFKWIWEDFSCKNINAIVRQYHGDQDYLNIMLSDKNRRFIDTDTVKSWRWQCSDGGMDMKTRQYRSPNAGTVIDPKTALMIFHGKPKPHEIADPVIKQYWDI